MDRDRDLAGTPLDPLGAALLTDVRNPWRRWARLSGAERVASYTRQSLFTLLWAFNGSVTVAAIVGLGDPAAAVGLGVGAAVLTVAGLLAMVPTLRAFPASPSAVWPRLGPLAVLCVAFAVVAIAVWEREARGTALLVALASSSLPLSLLSDRRPSMVVVVAGGVAFGVGGGAISLAAGLFVGVAFVFSGRASLWVLRIVHELDEARQAQASLAVMEERLRFSRDVHDVLGRRLSTIAVQAELASTLADRGDERAAERMLEVRGVAHEALREARELARGYRGTDFATELDGARSLLGSAGIDVEVHAGDLPRAWHEPAGWVVREAVTNILRHSAATRVDIRVEADTLRVANDGAPARADGGASTASGRAAADDGGAATHGGAGLRGLRERLVPLGASLEAGPDGDGGWVVVARLPGSGPLSARREPA